jgi:hypothetical protein
MMKNFLIKNKICLDFWGGINIQIKKLTEHLKCPVILDKYDNL